MPIITACISIVDVIVKTKGQERLSLLEIATAAVGSIVLLIYAASAGGLLKLLALEFIYALVFVGTLFILGCRCYRRIKRK